MLHSRITGCVAQLVQALRVNLGTVAEIVVRKGGRMKKLTPTSLLEEGTRLAWLRLCH